MPTEDVTEEMVDAVASTVYERTGNSVALHEITTRAALEAARAVDPLVAEVARLRGELRELRDSGYATGDQLRRAAGAALERS